MSLVMQFNDGIAVASLNDPTGWETVCNGKEMVYRHMVRGFKEQVYYAKTSESVDKIFKLTLSDNPEEAISETEIY